MEFSPSKERKRRREDILGFAQTELNDSIQRNIIARWLGR
jgi:hypothetical protein